MKDLKNYIIIIIGVLLICVSVSFAIFGNSKKLVCKMDHNLDNLLIESDTESNSEIILTYKEDEIKKSVLKIYFTFSDNSKWDELVKEWDNNQELISVLFDEKDEEGFKKIAEINKKKKFIVLTETIDFDKITDKVKEENDIDSRYEKIKTIDLAKENYEEAGYTCE